MSNGPPGLAESRRGTPIGPPSKGIEQISRELDIARARSEFFPGRDDVSDERAFKRMQQFDEMRSFKNKLIDEGRVLKDSKGNIVRNANTGEPVYLGTTPKFDTDSSSPTFGQYTSVSVADKAGELANKYGPTLAEVAGDFTRAAGDTLGNVAEGFLSGKVGIMAGIKAVADYATNKVKDGYNKLNSVQKEIRDNPDKYPLTSNGLTSLQVMNNNERLALEANRDLNSFAEDAVGILGLNEGSKLSGSVNEPIGTFGTAGPTAPVGEIDIQRLTTPITETGVFPGEKVKEAAIDRFSPEYIAEQKRILEALNRLEQVEELKPNAPGGTSEGTGEGDFLFPESYTIPFTDIEIPSLMRKGEEFITGGKGFNIEGNTGVTRDGEGSGDLRLNLKDDQASITQYNNPFNLEFKGQEGAEPGYGGESGQRFASFDTLDRGLKTGINRVAEIVGDGTTTEEFLNIYAPKSDNPSSFDNYLASLKKRVGPTIEPNEIKDLTKGVIRFENTPDIAGQYLDYLQRENDKIYGGIVS
jgi:hypothetical protein